MKLQESRLPQSPKEKEQRTLLPFTIGVTIGPTVKDVPAISVEVYSNPKKPSTSGKQDFQTHPSAPVVRP